MTLMFRALVLVLVGFVVGALMRPVQAQTDSSIFKVGQRLTLTFVGDRIVECNIAEIRGAFIKCEDNKIMWFNTATTIALTVR
jgi:hypothetical protein